MCIGRNVVVGIIAAAREGFSGILLQRGAGAELLSAGETIANGVGKRVSPIHAIRIFLILFFSGLYVSSSFVKGNVKIGDEQVSDFSFLSIGAFAVDSFCVEEKRQPFPLYRRQTTDELQFSQ